jgi:hypothetical protein
MFKFPSSDQILEELYQAGGETLVSVIHKLIASIWHKEELLHQWKESGFVPFHEKGDKTIIFIVGYHCYQLHTRFIKYPSFTVKSIHR